MALRSAIPAVVTTRFLVSAAATGVTVRVAAVAWKPLLITVPAPALPWHYVFTWIDRKSLSRRILPSAVIAKTASKVSRALKRTRSRRRRDKGIDRNVTSLGLRTAIRALIRLASSIATDSVNCEPYFSNHALSSAQQRLLGSRADSSRTISREELARGSKRRQPRLEFAHCLELQSRQARDASEIKFLVPPPRAGLISGALREWVKRAWKQRKRAISWKDRGQMNREPRGSRPRRAERRGAGFPRVCIPLESASRRKIHLFVSLAIDL